MLEMIASNEFLYTILFFFFQAEDGIRDDLVTGVQTCAFFFKAEDGIRDDLVTGVQTCAPNPCGASLRKFRARSGRPRPASLPACYPAARSPFRPSSREHPRAQNPQVRATARGYLRDRPTRATPR